MRSPLWSFGLAGVALVGARIATAGTVLMVIGAEYTAHPDHYGISGLASVPSQFLYQGQPIPPYTQRTQDILALMARGNQPLSWMAHPNWKYVSYPPSLQIANLIGLSQATGNAWRPDAIAMLNLVIDPAYEGPPNWRRQVAIEMGNGYSSQVPQDHIPAFLLEVDFHSPPAVFWDDCGQPYSVVWVPDNWHSLSARDAMEELFTAVRSRRVVGTVGNSRFTSCEIAGNTLTLQLTSPLKNIQLWAGGTNPVATWQNTATAAYNLSGLNGSEPFVWFFGYGDSLVGNWNTWTCNEKEVFFTSPMLRQGTTFVNQYSAVNLTDKIPIKVFFHYHTSISLDGQSAPTFEELLEQCRDIGVDAVLTTDHVPYELQGPFPSFVHTWDEVPSTAVWGSEPADVVTHALELLPSPIVTDESARIGFSLARAARVKLEIYDVQGRLVKDVRDELLQPGNHVDVVKLSAAGQYFIRLQVGRDTFTRKLVVHR